MNKVTVLLAISGGFFASCAPGEKRPDRLSIAGAYAREYSKEILNQSSGEKVGIRTYRDTIRILEIEGGFQVKNTRWMMNEYDGEGWQDMKHGESRPFPEYVATFDREANTLTPSNAGGHPILYIDTEKLFVGSTAKVAYTKVR